MASQGASLWNRVLFISNTEMAHLTSPTLKLFKKKKTVDEYLKLYPLR